MHYLVVDDINPPEVILLILLNVSSTGNAIDFGDLTSKFHMSSGVHVHLKLEHILVERVLQNTNKLTL